MARGNFGERLKRERELREVTLEEITSATRIGPRFLEALENEDWQKLPGGVFNRGFVRSIARYLGLDEEAFLAEYDLARNTPSQQEPQRPEDRSPSPPRWIPYALVCGAIVLVVALVAAGVYGWRYYKAHKTPGAAPSAAPSSRQFAAPAASTSPASSLELEVSVTAPAHLRIESDNNVVFDSDMRAGESHHFFALDSFQVSTSAPAAVLLKLNGQTMPPIGSSGSSGTMKLSRKDLQQATGGNSQP